MRKHILVVEDDGDLRHALMTSIQLAGYRVDEAENGLQALEILENITPELILLDMKMPVMNGWEFVAALRRRSKPQPPIVVLTAAHDTEQRALEVGAQGWVGKPCELSELITAIEQVIGKAEA
jgi:urea transport system substrate-binding protein